MKFEFMAFIALFSIAFFPFITSDFVISHNVILTIANHLLFIHLLLDWFNHVLRRLLEWIDGIREIHLIIVRRLSTQHCDGIHFLSFIFTHLSILI